jgi:transposase
MRRHPQSRVAGNSTDTWRFKQSLCHLTAIKQLRHSGLAQLVALEGTLHSWQQEIATMWRFTRSNGVTEGFHNKIETISRQAYGFRNFQNHRQRVQVLCA